MELTRADERLGRETVEDRDQSATSVEHMKVIKRSRSSSYLLACPGQTEKFMQTFDAAMWVRGWCVCRGVG